MGLLGLSPGSWALAQATDGPAAARTGDCPQRGAREDRNAYVGRIKIDCEARWSRMADARQTGGRSHDDIVTRCVKRCDANASTISGGALAGLLGGLAAAGGAAAAAGGGGSGDHPASP